MQLKLSHLCLAAGMLFFKPVQALEIWHSSTVWANQGMCSATFTLDSGMESVGHLKIGIALIDPQGKVVTNDELEVESFGDSEATRYQTTYGEGESYCDSDLRVQLVSLSVEQNGATRSLPLSLLTPREFVPFKITKPQGN